MNSIFIARQPVVTDSKELFAHELLFRDFTENPDIAAEQNVQDDLYATSRVAVNALNQFGINRLVGNKDAFINADEEFINSDFIKMLPKDRFFIEILEDVNVDKQLAERVGELRNRGYRFAIDDAVFDSDFFRKYEAILPIVEIVKIDIQLNEIENVKYMIERLSSYAHLQFLAEKVEDKQEFLQYKDAGCTLFQGYFFAKPEVSEKRSIDPSMQSLMKLTGLLASDSSTTGEIAAAFEESPDLALQLLQFLNSSHFAFKNPIKSISHAVMMVGKSDLLTWLYLLAYANGNVSKMESSPLVSLAAFRSKLMRKISKLHKDSKQMQDMAALTGTLSLADTLFDMSMEEILRELEIDESIKAAILQNSGILASYLKIANTVERADLKGCIERTRQIGIHVKELETSILDSY